MSSKTLVIKRLSRYPQTGVHDELNFKRGVNVLVGQPNTGKTQWLRMLDYLWGDPDPAQHAFDEDLVEKYERIEALIDIGGVEYLVERRWKDKGNIGKVFINGEPTLVEDFSKVFLGLLDIPVIHFPSGNPYASRKWPILSWRELYRHIYRRQDSWSDLAARQPESTQLACILYFLGIAENIYSETYGEVVRLNKEIGALDTAKDQFAKLLQRFSDELVDFDSPGQILTAESIKNLVDQLSKEEVELNLQREDILQNMKIDRVLTKDNEDNRALDELSQKWESLQDKLNQIKQASNNTKERLEELEEYKISVKDEYSRIKRASIAGTLMADLRVTHCPVCDRQLKHHAHAGHCYLCKEPQVDEEDESNSRQRLEFEIARLEAEKNEAEELVTLAQKELNDHTRQQKLVQEEFDAVRLLLRPIQRASAAILPPALAVLENRLGTLSEKKRQLDRLRGALSLRQELIDQGVNLVSQRDVLEKDLENKTASVDFDEAANDLANGINFYLQGEIAKQNAKAWTQGVISVGLRERSFSIKAGDKSWRKLGGTMSLYLLMAYNYSLLRLSNTPHYRYPGILILDMPAKFEDTQVTRDETESFVIAPFARIGEQTGREDFQVIVTGSRFEGLKGVNRIELTTIWS